MSLAVRTRIASPVSLTRTQKVRGIQLLVVAFLLGFVEFAPRMGVVGRTTLIPLSEMLDELLSLDGGAHRIGSGGVRVARGIQPG